MPANPDRSYPTQAEAEAAARKMGCSGAHQANGGWMPCATPGDAEVTPSGSVIFTGSGLLQVAPASSEYVTRLGAV